MDRPVAVPRDWIVLNWAVQCWKAQNQFLGIQPLLRKHYYVVVVPSVPPLNNSSKLWRADLTITLVQGTLLFELYFSQTHLLLCNKASTQNIQKCDETRISKIRPIPVSSVTLQFAVPLSTNVFLVIAAIILTVSHTNALWESLPEKMH